jgi:hypothetical protein
VKRYPWKRMSFEELGYVTTSKKLPEARREAWNSILLRVFTENMALLTT